MTERARALLRTFASLGAVDVAGHVGQWPYRLSASTDTDRLRRHADAHGLSAIWVSHLAALFGFDTRTGNAACLDACAQDARLRPFALLDPSEGTWRAELDWAAEAGFTGVRLAPGFHGYAGDILREAAAAAATAGLVVQLIVRLDDARVRHPRDPAVDVPVEDVVAFVHATAGERAAISGLNWVEWEHLVSACGNGLPPDTIVDCWHVNGPFGVADRWATAPAAWAFGGGFPVQAPEPTMLQLVASQLPIAAQRAIARGNAERVAGAIDMSGSAT